MAEQKKKLKMMRMTEEGYSVLKKWKGKFFANNIYDSLKKIDDQITIDDEGFVHVKRS